MVLGLTGASAHGMLERMDTDRDGIVDREEYMVSTRDALNADGKANKDARRSIYEFVGQVYQHCDLDGDGVLSEREVEFGQFLVGSEVAAARQAGGQKLPEEESDFGASLALGVLRQLDSNVDGRIDVEEFFDAFRAALTGWSWNEEDFEHPAMQVVMRRMFDKADVRSDGFLNSREVQYAVYLLDQFAVAELVSSIFRDLDLNGNRRIETRELEETLERLRQMRIPMQNSILSIIDEKFSEFDTDGDGALDETETRSLAAEVLHMNQAD
mmetsp:Transcript_63442/g.175473  ORF Transcript_63442/g.175473 Transcript_63442/m.175473 type:complete len:270 (-) Transcript_63442:83-892(-)